MTAIISTLLCKYSTVTVFTWAGIYIYCWVEDSKRDIDRQDTNIRCKAENIDKVQDWVSKLHKGTIITSLSVANASKQLALQSYSMQRSVVFCKKGKRRGDWGREVSRQ
ncbi:hypothetical protein ElyMa_000245400 [Elysia marginata]|uniref:Uncharacterized protein n=1 Tax=Elysia marginata TaxID=1093978 RepID=A0AAV4F2F2_9GAST|nr:hypothetical protein ElyMa_000245400 [Elysia marginata]